MSDVDQHLKITVVFEGERDTREKTYTDHTEFLRDLRKWRRFAARHNYRFEEKTKTTIQLGAVEGPLFSGAHDTEPDE